MSSAPQKTFHSREALFAELGVRRRCGWGRTPLRPGAAAETVALLAVDAARLPVAFQRVHFLWLGPVHTIAAAAMLYYRRAGRRSSALSPSCSVARRCKVQTDGRPWLRFFKFSFHLVFHFFKIRCQGIIFCLNGYNMFPCHNSPKG